jgi:hypothetical protein
MSFHPLDSSLVNDVALFLSQKKETIKTIVPNEIIRDDVFKLVGSECVLVYYPLNDSEIDGFHVSKQMHGHNVNFVYINTSHYLEKQIFTVSHELGHIWGVDDFLVRECHHDKVLVAEQVEHVMNRFAAMLLMPHDHFLKDAKEKLWSLSELSSPTQRIISQLNLYRCIVYLMDTYFTTYRSVAIRLFEVGILKDTKTTDLVIALENEDFTKMIVKESGYTRLMKATKKSGIEDFAFVLENAQERELVPERMVSGLRKKLGIPELPAGGMVVPLNEGGTANNV